MCELRAASWQLSIVGGQREHPVVLPLPVEEQVAAGQALLAEAGLLEHARRRLVLGHYRGLDSVQAEVLERDRHREPDRLRRDTPAAVLDVDAVAQVCVLQSAAGYAAQRDPTDQSPAA